MSTINIECINKTLTIVDSPSIEVGADNSIQFDFCSLWDGYDKTVHFYSDETTCYSVAITDNLVVIPSNLVSEGRSFYFFVEGVSGELKRRSHVFKLKIESSLLVVENPDSDVQTRLIDLIENWYSKDFDYSKLTDEEKAEIKQDVTTVNAQFSKVYNVTAEKSIFPIEIERYAHGIDILEVYINGMRLVDGVDYTNDGQNITLTKPLNVIGQLEIVVFKSVSATVADLASFKGERGERGEAGKDGSNGKDGNDGKDGVNGKDGVSISSVTQTTTSTESSGTNVVTVRLSDGTTSTFNVKNGERGEKGDKLTVEELTDADKQELREGLVAYQKKLSYTVSLASGSKTFTIPDSNFKSSDMLILHLNGIYFHEGVDYTISGSTVTLTNAVANASSAEIEIIRAVILESNDYSLLKGDKGDRGDRGDTGLTGDTGVGISSVVQTTTSTDDDGNNVITVTLTNGQTSTFTVQNGSKGSKGDKGDTGNVSEVQYLRTTDTRNTNEAPSYYMSNLARTFQTEFKSATAIGLSDQVGAVFIFLITMTPWSDNSGGRPVQIAFHENKGMYMRGSSSDSAWGTWYKIYDSSISLDAQTLQGKSLSSQANNRNAIAYIGSDGVMEAGKYIDFHESNGDANYSLRLTSSSGALNCSGTFTATKVYGAVFN